MKINNLNEPFESKFRKVIRDTRQQQTRPTGTKTFEWGSSIAFRDAAGGVRHLDAGKITAIDDTLAEARDTVARAADRLQVAESRLDGLDEVVVDVKNGNIDVPGTLAARVVQAMDAEMKRLIVTEDAILNNVSVVGKIIADQLAVGDLTVSGRFQSGAPGMPSVIIPTARRLTAGRQQVAVWLSHNGVDTTLEDGAPTAGMWLDMGQRDTPTPMQLRGRMGSGIQSVGTLIVDDTYRKGDGTIRGVNHLTVSSGTFQHGDLHLRGFAIKLHNFGGGDTGYSKSWGGGGLRPLQMNSSTGTIYTETSSRRVKQDIEDAAPDDDWLDLRTVTYRARLAVETAEAYDEKVAADPSYEAAPDELEMMARRDTRFVGRIAEELHDAGYTDQVIYDDQGRPDGIDYARDGARLIPLVRRNRDRIASLEERVNRLEAKING